MPAEMKFEDVVAGVAREINPTLLTLLDSPEGRAVVAKAINEKVEEVRTKLSSEIAEERKLRTAAEDAAKDLLVRFEKFERRMSYDRDFGIHRGLDGKMHPSVSREAAESLATLVRAMAKKDGNAIRAVSEGTGSEGGYTVQLNVAEEVLRLIPEYGLYPKLARPFPVSTQKTQVGSVLSQMNAYWIGENAPITPAYPGFGQVTLEAKQLGAFIPIPMTLIDDSQVDIGSLIADLIRECIGKEIDRVAIAGQTAANGGTDPFDGLLWSPGINRTIMTTGDTSIQKFNSDYLVDMQNAVPEGGDDESSYIFSKSVFNYLRKQKDADGNPVFQRPADGQPGTIYDCDYHKSYRMPAYAAPAAPSTRFALFGNWKRWALFGMRKELSIATSDVAGAAFQQNQLAVRGITRVALASFGAAFTELETAAS